MKRSGLALLALMTLSSAAQAGDTTAEALSKILSSSNNDSRSANCFLARSVRDRCEAAESDNEKKLIKETITFDGGLTKHEIDCKLYRAALADCETDTSNVCESTFKEYLTARTERTSKCSLISSCSSQTYTKCNEYLNDNRGTRKIGGKESLDRFLKACPFYAHKVKETAQENEKDLDASLDLLETQIRELKEKADIEKKDLTERIAEMDKNIAELEGLAKEALDGVQARVAKIAEDGSAAQTNLATQIYTLRENINVRVTTAAENAKKPRKEAQLKIGLECYKAGMEAARFEAARLKSTELSRKDINQQLAAGGAVAWLREVANNAYEDCMKSGPMANGIKLSLEQEKAELAKLQSEVNVMQNQLNNLQAMYTKLSETLPKAQQEAMQEALTKSTEYSKQAQAKRQEKMQFLQISQQMSMNLNMSISQLQFKLIPLKKERDEAKKNAALAKSVSSPALGDEKLLAEARSADMAFDVARKAASDACCTNGKLRVGTGIDGLTKSICISDGGSEPTTRSSSEREP